MGMGLDFHTCTHGVMGITVPVRWSHVLSNDFVDQHHQQQQQQQQQQPTNHCCEQLLMGWKRGASMVSKQPQWPQHSPNDANCHLGL
jgi:hypothetical protein